MNELLKAKILDSYLGVVDINGYKYNKHIMCVQKLKRITCLMPVYMDIYPGDCFETTKWVLTCLEPNKKPIDVVIRIDEFTQCSPEGFEMSEYLNARVVGLFCTSSKCVLKEISVDKVPFFNATLKVKNAEKESFDLYVLGFWKIAKQMSTIKGGSVLECMVTVKRRQNGDGWEFPILSINIKSEVKE